MAAELEIPDCAEVCSLCDNEFLSRGKHCLAVTKCGHLFGKSCLFAKFKEAASRELACPQCQQMTLKSDVIIVIKPLLQLEEVAERTQKARDQLCNRLDVGITKLANFLKYAVRALVELTPNPRTEAPFAPPTLPLCFAAFPFLLAIMLNLYIDGVTIIFNMGFKILLPAVFVFYAYAAFMRYWYDE